MNGNFIFTGLTRERALPLEAALRGLPVTAVPTPTTEALAGSNAALSGLENKYGKELYFEVWPNADSDREEYFVVPLRTHDIEGISEYTFEKQPESLTTLSARRDLVEVEFCANLPAIVFNLCLESYSSGPISSAI